MKANRLLAPAGVLFSLLLMTNCEQAAQENNGGTTQASANTSAVPPVAKVVDHPMTVHDHTRNDPYYWLREREDQEVIDYLTAENEYTDARTSHTEALQETLFEEMKSRLKEDDESVPVKVGEYYYYSRTEKGKEYSIRARKKGSMEAAEEVIVDGNVLAEGTSYFSYNTSVSRDHNLVAISTDTVGRRFYDISFKDLRTGEMLADVLPQVNAGVQWAADNKTVFYTRKDPETLRSYQVWKHVLGTSMDSDELVFQEDNTEYLVWLGSTSSNEYITINSYQTLSTETRVVNASTLETTLFLPREEDHIYSIDHNGEQFMISSNWEAKNFRILTTDKPGVPKTAWKELIAHRSDVLLEGFTLRKDFWVLKERKDGLAQMRVMSYDGRTDRQITFNEPTYVARSGGNAQGMEDNTYRYNYESLNRPTTTYDQDLATGEQEVKKVEEVPGTEFKPEDYTVERVMVTARDGETVPLSIVYHKSVARNSGSPCLLYSYGSYGSSSEPWFSTINLSLLDRGFVYAVAHIRGGQEKGRAWYEDGKLLNKKNTFYDFIDCSKFLIDNGYSDSEKLFAYGGSAGGLLMGAIINMAPELYKGVVAAVPFVDVVTTMLDETIPLTTFEYDEWGNPNEKEYYEYMLSYSPYDQVEAKDYPNLLVTTGLHDSQVQYWEPAKWVAKLRATKTDDNVLLLKTNMDAGHGGASGRYRRLTERAFIFAFMVDLAGAQDVAL